MAKPTGYLYWRKTGWRARKLEVDGERVRKTFDLKTDNKAAARIKLRRLLEQNAPTETEAVRVETFREATERIVGERAIRTNRGAKSVETALVAPSPVPRASPSLGRDCQVVDLMKENQRAEGTHFFQI